MSELTCIRTGATAARELPSRTFRSPDERRSLKASLQRLYGLINGVFPNLSVDFLIRPGHDEGISGEGERTDFGSTSGGGDRESLRFRFRGREEGSKQRATRR